MTKKYNRLILFVLYTYAITWILWLPAIIQSLTGHEISTKKYIIGIIGLAIPSIAGSIFLLREGNLKNTIQQLFRFRINAWIILCIVLLPFIMLIAHVINVLLFNGDIPVISEPYLIPLQFIIILIAGGPFIEEIGWRGYLQTKVNKNFSIIIAGLIVGIIWAIWHIPLFFIKEMLHNNLPLDQFFITAILMSIIINYFQVRAQCGIWPALILHTYMNLTMEVTPLFNQNGHTLWILTNCVLFVIVLIFIALQFKDSRFKVHTSNE